jgi:hypothetical protein
MFANRNDITSRFLEFYEYLINSNQARNDVAFCHGTILKTSMLTEVKKGRSNISITQIASVFKKYSTLNLTWLLDGQGNMLAPQAGNPGDVPVYTGQNKIIERILGSSLPLDEKLHAALDLINDLERQLETALQNNQTLQLTIEILQKKTQETRS